MNWKKWIALPLSAALALGLLAGCSSSAPEGTAPADSTPSQAAGDGASAGELASFTADTLAGETFTQDDIMAKDVTIINFWGTYCGPCIAEMPDLAAYAKALPDNVQLVTVCVDALSAPESAERILSDAGYEGVTLVDGGEVFLSLCASVQYIPTTIFVDGTGTIVGDVIIGGQTDLAGTLTSAVNQVLTAAGKAEISVEIG